MHNLLQLFFAGSAAQQVVIANGEFFDINRA
jgi:hypothetical protein